MHIYKYIFKHQHQEEIINQFLNGLDPINEETEVEHENIINEFLNGLDPIDTINKEVNHKIKHFYTIFKDPNMREIIFGFQKNHFINLQKELTKKELDRERLDTEICIKDLKIGDIVEKWNDDMCRIVFYKITRFTKCYMFARKLNENMVQFPKCINITPKYKIVSDKLDDVNVIQIKMKITSSITTYLDKTKEIVLDDDQWEYNNNN